MWGARVGSECGEEGKEELEHLIPVGKREASVDDSFHGVREKGDVIGQFVYVTNHV